MFKSKVPLAAGERRLIISTCEKGQVEDVGAMRGIKAGLDAVKKQNPNFVDIAANEVWRSRNPQKVADTLPTPSRWNWKEKAAVNQRIELMKKRKTMRVGMPRVLNMYMYAPMFSAYLESLGLEPENLVYSEFTGQEMYRQGAGRGAIDPCFPSKIGIPHVYNLIFQKHQKKPLDAIFFPMIDTLHQPMKNCSGSNACPTVTATPECSEGCLHQGKRRLQGERNTVPRSHPEHRRQEAVRAANVPDLGADPRSVGRGERACHRGSLTRPSTTSTAASASGRARCWTRWSGRTGSASSCWGASIITIPA